MSSQTVDNIFRPSLFLTSGSYSNGIQSLAGDYYAAYAFHPGDYVDAGYEMIRLEHPSWEYNQSLVYAGGGLNYYPYYLQCHYARLSGTYDAKGVVFSYNDKGNVVSLVSYYNWDLFYFGFSYTYLEVSGYKEITSHQAGPRLAWLISPLVVLSAAPLYSHLSDGRKLFSLLVQSSFNFSSEFFFQLSGSVGERAYYFHPDLLTLYNQDDTQRTALGVRCEYEIWKPITLVASYQHSSFAGYTVQYATIGVKGAFAF